jgi:5'-3' exonuclease
MDARKYMIHRVFSKVRRSKVQSTPSTLNIHLVDGTFELFRAFYARAARDTAAPGDDAAVRGLARSLLALLAEPGVTHVAVAFDHEIESFRNDMFEGYKRGDGIDPVLFAQFAPAENMCRALGIVTWPMIEFEADDALASAAARFSSSPEVEQTILCSPDKDLAQCVQGSRVVCLDRMRRRVLDETGVFEKFGVWPRSIPDWLALVGDSADGIPGIPRWGAKSAATLLARYGTLEAIPEEFESWDVPVRGAKALADNLRAGREDAALFRRLATLRLDVPIAESLDALRWRGPDEPALQRLTAQVNDEFVLQRARKLAANATS